MWGYNNENESIEVGAFHSADDNWSEHAITWNNQPTASNTATSTITVTKKWNSWNVKSDIVSETNNLSTWVLKGIIYDDDEIGIASKERGGTSKDPRLSVNYSETTSTDYDFITGYSLDGDGTGNATLTTNSGSILDGDLGVAPSDLDISANNITMLVTGGTIGQSGPGKEIDIAITGTGTVTDNVLPIISLLSRTAANGNGWNNTDVDVVFSAVDPNWYTGAGINTGASTLSLTLSGEGSGQSVTGIAYDNVGNSASLLEDDINIDKTDPTIVLNTRTPFTGDVVSGWNNGDVVVTYTVDDQSLLSGVDTSPPSDYGDDTLSAEGAGQSTSGIVYDIAGNSATYTEKNINIDKTDPIITASRDPLANANGWNNETVTVSYVFGDALSGVDAAVSSTGDDVLSSEGVNQEAFGRVYDIAGNSAMDGIDGINIDKTPPDITLNRSVATNVNGWNNVDVTVSYDIDAGISGVAASDVFEGTYNSDGIYDTYAKVTDLADNYSEVFETVRIDKTSPDITLNRSVAAHGNGWNDEPVTVGYTIDAGISGVAASDVFEGTYNSDGIYDTYAKVTDLADNYSEVLETVSIKLHGTGTFTWDGSTDSSWDEWENWDTHVAPSDIDTVVVADVTNNPALVVGTTAEVLTINTGGLLDVVGHTLTITNSFINSGEVTSSSGNIEITAGDTTTGKITNDHGWVNVTANSPITVSDSITASGDITLEAQESGSEEAGDDLTLGANVESTNGNIYLYAGDNIIQNLGSVITHGGLIDAEAAYNDNDNLGAFTQASGTSFVSGSDVDTAGIITVSARDDVKLALLNADADTSRGDVEVTSLEGDITDNDLGTVTDDPFDYDIIAHDLNLYAPNGTIGGTSPAEIDININGSLDFDVTGGGDVTIYNSGTDDLELLAKITTTGTVYIYTEGNLLVLNIDPTVVTLISNTGDIIGQDNGGNPNIIAGELYMYAPNGSILGVGANSGYFLTQITTLKDAQAQDSIHIKDVGDSGQSVNIENVSAGGITSVDIVTTDDMIVGYVFDPTDVALTSLNGSILDDDNNSTKIITSNLSLTANQGIGDIGTGQIDTSVDTLSAEAGNGSIYLENNDKDLKIIDAIASVLSEDVVIDINVNNGSLVIEEAEEIKPTDIPTCVKALVSGNGTALINLSADDGISIFDDIVLADVDGDGSATVNIITSGDIDVIRSQVKANMEGDGDATVTLNAGGAITIDDSETFLPPDVRCLLALIDGDGDALIDIDADGDISIINDLVLADVDGNGSAVIDMYTDDGSIKITNGSIVADVEGEVEGESNNESMISMQSYKDIIVTDSLKTILAHSYSARGKADADVLMYSENGKIEVKNSSVRAEAEGLEGGDAYVEMSADTIRVTGSDVKADADSEEGDAYSEIKMRADGWRKGIFIKDSELKATSDSRKEGDAKAELNLDANNNGNIEVTEGSLLKAKSNAEYDSKAKVRITADKDILVKDDSRVIADAKSRGNDEGEKAHADMYMESDNGKIEVKGSLVNAIAYGVSRAITNIDMRANNIKITKSDIIADSDTDRAPRGDKGEGGAYSEIKLRADESDKRDGRDIERAAIDISKGSLIEANTRAIGRDTKAEVNIGASDGSIRVQDSTVKSDAQGIKAKTMVRMNAYKDIIVTDSLKTILAHSYSARGKADADVLMYSENGKIEVKNSSVRAEAEGKEEADANIEIESDNIRITSADVIANAESDIDHADASIYMRSHGNKGIFIEDGSLIADADGESDSESKITLHADKNILVGGTIRSTSVEGGVADVELTAGGWIRDVKDSETIIADTLTLSAVDGIGEEYNYLDTEVNTLTATTTGEDADIYIEEADGIKIDTLNATGLATITANGSSILGSITTEGDFNFDTSSGDVTILSGTVTSNSGGVDIQSDLGSIYADGSGPHIVALLTSSLIAPNGVVGTVSDPIDVNITAGDLEITAGGIVDDPLFLVDGSITAWNNGDFWGVSSNITGTVSGSIIVNPATSLFPPDLDFDPQGYVLFNDTEIWPDLVQPVPYTMSPEILAQLLSLLGPHFDWPAQEILNLFRIYPMDASGAVSVYFYHPIVSADSSAFEGFQLSEEMYEFIEGQLKLKEGDFFSWLEEELK